MLRQGITTSDIITKKSLENAITVVMALGGLQTQSCTYLQSLTNLELI
jgi:dihydroxy-acid dehydratase